MTKLNFGCGSNKLDGWQNFDIEMDIRKLLPFQAISADFILVEHCLEHVTHREAWCFLCECRRILKPGGVVRVGVPDITLIWLAKNKAYAVAVQKGGHGDGTSASCVKAAIFEHGHESVWNHELLFTVMGAVGFDASFRHYGESPHPELKNVEGHHKVVGLDVAVAETSVVEGTKH